MPEYSEGFTIVELMMTLAVAAILSAVAAPSFNDIIQNNRLVTQVNELQASLSLARSEAIKRNDFLTVCPSRDGANCMGNWESGWLVFVNDNVDGTVNAGEEILLVHGAISHNNTLTFNRARVTYAGSGKARGGSNGSFTLCDGRGARYAKGIIISNTGRARLAIDKNGNGIVENGSKKSVRCP